MNKLNRLLNLAQSQTGYTKKDNDKDLDTIIGAQPDQAITPSMPGISLLRASQATVDLLGARYISSGWICRRSERIRFWNTSGRSSTIVLLSATMRNLKTDGCRQWRYGL